MINFFLEKNNKLQQKLILFLLFICLLVVGSSIFHFYGISIDERANINLGYITLKYIYEVFFPLKISTIDNLATFPKLSDIPYILGKDHGSFLNTLCAYIDVFFNIEKTKIQYLFRHYINFIIFFISVYFFYLIGKFRYNDWRLGILGIVFLILSPRIFAQSFYNNKDVVFMSLYIISLYSCVKFIYKPNIKRAVFFALTSALATDIRIMGIMLPILTLFFILLLSLRDKTFFKNNLLSILIFLILTPSFIIIFWPFLWSDPIINFIWAFKSLSSFPLDLMKNLYFGNYIYSTYVPWHYSLIWISITTPILYVVLFLFGFSTSFTRVIKRLLNIDENKKFNDLWRGKKEMIDLMILLNFFLPIFAVIIFNSTLYDGWRQLYFIYPSFLLLSVYGFQKIIKKIKKKKLHNYFLTFVILSLAINLVNMIKIHPYQYVYFNFLGGKEIEKNFEADYWGVSIKQAIEYIISNNNKNIYKIYPASNIDLNLSKLIFSNSQKNKIKVVNEQIEADFIISTGRFLEGNPEADFAKIPDDFTLYKEIRTDRIKLITMYKKNF